MGKSPRNSPELIAIALEGIYVEAFYSDRPPAAGPVLAKVPKKRPPKTLKGDVVRMRVTAEQKRALTDAADRAGLELSAWLRQLALRAAGVLSDPK